MTPSSQRRTSSNGVQTLRAIFEGSRDQSPAASSKPGSRRVTSSFIPVEPVRLSARSSFSIMSTSPDRHGDNETSHIRFGAAIDRTACLDLTLQQYLAQDETKYEEVIVAVAVVKLVSDWSGNTLVPSVLLLHRAEDVDSFAGHVELPSERVEAEDQTILHALLEVLSGQTGLMGKEIVGRLPDIAYADQEMVVADDGSETVDAHSAVQITYIVSVDSEDIVLGSGYHKGYEWVTVEDLGILEMRQPMGQAVRGALNYLEANGGRVKAGGLAIAHSEDRPISVHPSTPPPVLETSGQFDGLPEDDNIDPETSASPSSSSRQEFSILEDNKQSEHTEKNVSALKDEEAELQPADVTKKATFDSTQSESPRTQQREGDTIEETPPTTPSKQREEQTIEETPPTTPSMPQEAPPTTNGQEGMSPSPARTPTHRLSSPGILNGSSKMTPSKSPSSKESTTTARGPTGAKGATSSSVNAHRLDNLRSTKPPIATQRNTRVPSQSKPKSPTRSIRVASNPTAATASSSAKHDRSTMPERPASTRTRRPIDGAPHFLSSTASSVARKDISTSSTSAKPQTLPFRPAESTRRDRTSIASATNGTGRRPTTTNPQSSLQPSNDMSSTKQPGSRISSTSTASKAASGGFLARMTRPTAASSGKTFDKSDVKATLASGEQPGKLAPMRSKTKEAPHDTLPKRGVDGRQVSRSAKPDLNASIRGRIGAPSSVVNGKKAPREAKAQPAAPVEPQIDADDKAVDATARVEENSGTDSGVTETEMGNGGQIQDDVAEPVVEEHAGNGSLALEERMTETPELGESVIR